jgi:uncharacterized membrane protein (GlpM family)
MKGNFVVGPQKIVKFWVTPDNQRETITFSLSIISYLIYLNFFKNSYPSIFLIKKFEGF